MPKSRSRSLTGPASSMVRAIRWSEKLSVSTWEGRSGNDPGTTASGEDLQQNHAHRLRVIEAGGEQLLAVAAGDAHLLVAR